MRAPALRASLLQAVADDYGGRSISCFRKLYWRHARFGEAAPAPGGYAAAWVHGNARWHMWRSEATGEAFKYNEDELMITSTMVVAELQVSRNFDPLFVEAPIFQVLSAADSQVAAWRGGRQLGPISFLAAGTICNGVEILRDGVVARSG